MIDTLTRVPCVITWIIILKSQGLDSPVAVYCLIPFDLHGRESQKGEEDIITIFQSSKLMCIQVSWTKKYSK